MGLIFRCTVTQVMRLHDAFNEPFRRLPTAKRPQQSNGDKAANGENQARPTGEGFAGGNTEGESNTQTKEAIPVSKLINREDETSVREALKGVRGKASKQTASKLEVKSGNNPPINEDRQPANLLQTESTVDPLPDSIQEEYVISLDD